MRASLKSINITPPISMQMAGYSERDHGAEGIHDELYAKIIVIDDGIKKVALAICDVIGVDQNVSEQVRKIVKGQTDIEPECIMISAIHTHSSVFACRLRGLDFLHNTQMDKESDEAYYQQFIQKIANGIIWANADLVEANIGFGMNHIHGLGTNRNDPNAYYDDSVNVIKISDKQGNVLGVIANHACHPTVLNQHNYFYSADYPAYFRTAMEVKYPQAVVAFLQGAAGSASTRYTKKESSFNEAKRFGTMLANASIQAIDNILAKDDITVLGKCTPLTLQVKKFPNKRELEEKILNYEGIYEALKNQSDATAIRKAYVTLQGAQREYRTSQNIHVDSITSNMQMLDFGVCKIISIPGDVFGEIGRDIKALRKDESVIVAGYTNDFVGYIVSKEGYQMDCYEKNMTIFDESSHERIMKVAKKLL